jgi:thioesterase domain-containing protein
VTHPGEILESPRSKLVHLKRGSGRESVLVLPGIGGSVLTLIWLARTYPGPEHVVGLEPISLTGVESPISSISALASGHLSAVAPSAREDARWHLLGHGFGAAVVMEMAHQLEGAGEPVGTVVLLQPMLRLGGALEDEEMARAEADLRAADRLRSALQEAAAGRQLRLRDPELANDLHCLGIDPALFQFDVGLAANMLEYIGSALRTFCDHTPRRISSRVHLLVTADIDIAGTAERLRELTGGVELQRLSFSSDDVLRQPCVRSVSGMVASLVGGAAGIGDQDNQLHREKGLL